MSAKILVADDSLTIQKVVNITLSSQGHDITECYDEEALFNMLKKDKYDIILLDYNLSEDRSIYQVVSEIRSQDKDVAIMALMGTFDTMDNEEAKNVELDDYIVKPFEGAKFVGKINALLNNDQTLEKEQDIEEVSWGDSESVDDVDEEVFSSGDDASDWVVNAPLMNDELENQDELNENGSVSDALKDEMNGWGMEVPGVIETGQSNVVIPPVIEDSIAESEDVDSSKIASFVSPKFATNEEDDEIEEDDGHFIGEETANIDLDSMELDTEPQVVPDDNDLAYPGGENFADESDEIDAQLSENMKNKLISLDDLNISEEDKMLDDEVDDTEDSIDIGPLMDEHKDLEEDIQDEVSPDEFWAADSSLNEIDSEPSNKLSKSIEEAGKALADLEASPVQSQPSTPYNDEIRDDDISFNIDRESFKKSLTGESQEADSSVPVFNEEEILSRLRESMSQIIEDSIKKYCNEKVEQVAWEIIPDLAENMIRKELNEIAESIKSQDS